MAGRFLKFSFFAVLGVALSGAGAHAQGQPNAIVDPKAQDIPQPKQPDTPSPLQPLYSPKGADPAGPIYVPPSIFGPTPTAEADSVTKRGRPEYDPEGIELDQLLGAVGLLDRETAENRTSALGSFEVFPTVEFATSYDSNLFRNGNPKSTFIHTVAPAVRVASNWTSHSLEFFADSEIARHQSQKSEDFEDYGFGVTGVLEIYDNAQVSGTASYNRGHSSRGEINDPEDIDAANTFDRINFNLGGRYDLLPLSLTANFAAVLFDFKSDALVNNEDLDRAEFTFNFRSSYELDEGTNFFVQPSVNFTDYDLKLDSSGFEQNTHGYGVQAGLRWDASGVTFAEFGIGYLRQVYDEARFADIDGLAASARAVWNFTDLWTLTLDLQRSVEDTADEDFSGVLSTRFNTEIDYEFLYNTIFSVKFGFAEEDYRGGNRTDYRYDFGFQARHLLNEYLWGEFTIDIERLDAGEEGGGFSATSGAFRLGSHI